MNSLHLKPKQRSLSIHDYLLLYCYASCHNVVVTSVHRLGKQKY